jgi:hypothetical protein
MARLQLPDGQWVDVDEQTGMVSVIDPYSGQPTGQSVPLSSLLPNVGAAAGAAVNAIPRTTPGTVSPYPLPGVPGGAITPPASVGPVGAGGALPGGVGGAPPPATTTPAATAAAAPEDDPTRVPLDPSVSNPTPPLPAGSSLNDQLLAWARAHGGISGPATTVKIKIDPRTGAYTDKNEQAHPWSQYMFGDGSRLVVNDQGQTEPTWTVDKSGANKALRDFVTEHGEQIGQADVDQKRSPNWPNDPNPYWVYHFKNGTSVTMDGSGHVADITKGAAAAEGATRSNVQNGYEVQEVYRGGQWVVDPSVPPKPYTPKTAAEPKEGDTRPNVQGGYQVQEVYRGGQWVVDPSVAPRPYTPETAAKPVEGQIRNNVQNGYQVQEVYRGGQWVVDPNVAPKPYTPEALAAAQKAAGAPKEGDIRPNVQSGYQVQEVYRGGQWVVDPTVAPKRFTPSTIQQVTASSTEPYLTTYNPDTGQYTQQPNQGFIPKTPAEVAARVSQLQQAAAAQRDQLAQQQKAGVITADQATQKFDQWWQQNVESQKAALSVAQQQAQLVDQQKQQELARANLATAQAAGTEVTRAMQSAAPNVGPGFGAAIANTQNALAGRTAPQPMSAQDLQRAFVAPTPDYAKIYEQATAQALAHISPTAAQLSTGQPTPTGLATAQGMDITSALNPTNYRPGFAPPPTPTADVSARIANGLGAGGLGPATPAAPAAATPSAYDWYALQQRLAADQAAQQAQAQVQFPSPLDWQTYQPAF